MKKRYVLFRMFVCLEVDEDEKVDEIGQLIRNEIDEMYEFSERDGCVLNFSSNDVLKESENIDDMYDLDDQMKRIKLIDISKDVKIVDGCLFWDFDVLLNKEDVIKLIKKMKVDVIRKEEEKKDILDEEDINMILDDLDYLYSFLMMLLKEDEVDVIDEIDVEWISDIVDVLDEREN